ncbi:MAG: PQQ-binding-like beta-propeller repeat protein [Verrucomicrobia bacterium]|nr:PQQ-binding-like beta-propeller repeat protein [Verrucomicrobiota bacterium]
MTLNKTNCTAIATLALIAATLALGQAHADQFEEAKPINWHHWRGPDANGVSTTARPPVQWSSTNNIQWKTPIEGNGSSTPIIWGNKLFILTAINTGEVDPSLPKPEDQPKRMFGITHPNSSYEFIVLCLDRHTGKILWRQTATKLIPHEGAHRDNNFASASPTTDGERLYCWFGSAGLYCYDLNGNKIWERNLGKIKMGASLGEGCSPVVHEGKIVIVRDHSRQSSIEVLNAKNGKSLWKVERHEKNAWATPAIVTHSGKTQVITTASGKVRSYDLNSGNVIWKCAGLTGNAIPCPVVESDTVYCMTGYKGYSLMAIPLNAKGDITGSGKILWTKNRGTPYVPSPLLYDGLLVYTQSNQALYSAVSARSGKTHIDRERLKGLSSIYGSPVGAAGRIYLTDRSGTTLVLKRSRELSILARNKLGEQVVSSPALVGRQLFLRGRNHLHAIAQEKDLN